MRWLGFGEEKRNAPKAKDKGKHTYTKPGSGEGRHHPSYLAGLTVCGMTSDLPMFLAHD